MEHNYYHVLGLDNTNVKEVTASTIRKQYLKMAKIHHPDTGGDSESFRQVKRAYEVLSDPMEKEKYDKQMFGTTAWWDKPILWSDWESDVSELSKVVILKAAKAIPLNTPWSADLIITVLCRGQEDVGKLFHNVSYVARRAKVQGSVIEFMDIEQTVTFRLEVWDEEEYLVLNAHGNDIITSEGEIHRGDLLVDLQSA